jgi:uncharacterized protein (DUF1697 family)
VSRYAAFLRGMNLGGRRLRNDELRGHFLAMGFAEVETFRASGNVVFAASLGQAGGRSPDALAGYIEQGLAASLGYAVPTFIRDEAEVRAIAAAAPFEEERLGRCAGKLQVALFAVTPARDAQVDALALAGEQDGLVFAGRELYWLPSGGVLDSALDMKGIERLLGPMTMRTKGTIEQIAAKHFR